MKKLFVILVKSTYSGARQLHSNLGSVTYDCMILGRLFHFFELQFPHL